MDLEVELPIRTNSDESRDTEKEKRTIVQVNVIQHEQDVNHVTIVEDSDNVKNLNTWVEHQWEIIINMRKRNGTEDARTEMEQDKVETEIRESEHVHMIPEDIEFELFKSKAEQFEFKTVTVVLDWNKKTVSKDPKEKVCAGKEWRQYSVEDSLEALERDVRRILRCKDKSNILFLTLVDDKETLSDPSARCPPFYSSKTIKFYQCNLVNSDVFTIHCEAKSRDDPVWVRFKSKEDLLQYEEDDLIKLTVDGLGVIANFGTKFESMPCKISWPKNAPMIGFEKLLQMNLIPIDGGATLFLVILDSKYPRGWAHFYSFLTPKEMRLTPGSTILCVGLYGDDEQCNLEKEVVTRRMFKEQGIERFGIDFFKTFYQLTVLHHMDVKIVWSIEELNDRENMDRQVSALQTTLMTVTWDYEEPLEELEIYLRNLLTTKQPGMKLFLQVHFKQHLIPFYGFLTLQQLQFDLNSSTAIYIEAKSIDDTVWLEYFKKGLQEYGDTFERYYRRCVMSPPKTDIKFMSHGRKALVRIKVVKGPNVQQRGKMRRMFPKTMFVRYILNMNPPAKLAEVFPNL